MLPGRRPAIRKCTLTNRIVNRQQTSWFKTRSTCYDASRFYLRVVEGARRVPLVGTALAQMKALRESGTKKQFQQPRIHKKRRAVSQGMVANCEMNDGSPHPALTTDAPARAHQVLLKGMVGNGMPASALSSSQPVGPGKCLKFNGTETLLQGILPCSFAIRFALSWAYLV